jgi:hypothetical protein
MVGPPAVDDAPSPTRVAIALAIISLASLLGAVIAAVATRR